MGKSHSVQVKLITEKESDPKVDHNITLAGLLLTDANTITNKLERERKGLLKGLYVFRKEISTGEVCICNGIEFPNPDAVDLLLYLIVSLEKNNWERKLTFESLRRLIREIYGVKTAGKTWVDQIKRSLIIWSNHKYYFPKSFLWHGQLIEIFFGVIDDWEIKSQGRGKPAKIEITFNEKFVEICKNTDWYRRPSWLEIKKLRKEVAKSLYMLAINYKPNERAKTWRIYIDKDLKSWYRNALNSLANPKYLKPYYVLKRLNGAIEEINQKTNLQMELRKTPQGNYCIDIKERVPSGTCRLELPYDNLPEDSKALLIAYLSANSDRRKINNIEGFLRSLNSKELKSYLREAQNYFESLVKSRSSEQLLKEFYSWAETTVPEGVRRALFKKENIVDAEESIEKIVFYCRSLSLAKFYNKEYSSKLREYFGKEIEFKPI